MRKQSVEKIDLSVVILNYNTKDFLLGCLQSIKEADLGGINYEVIVVDNHSSDKSLEAIQNAKFKIKNYLSTLSSRPKGNLKLKIIENDSNVGFSKGNNVGVKQASGRYVLFLNPDTEVSKEAIKTAYHYMEEHKRVGTCTVRLELTDGTLDDASHRAFPTPLNSLTHFLRLEKFFPKSKIFARYTMGWLIDSEEPHEVDSISGAFFFVRRKAGEEVACLPARLDSAKRARQGWWDEDFFWYGEDLDFCYRLKQKGWRIVFIPGVKILHYRGVSSGIKSHSQKISTAGVETRVAAARASTQAMRIFYKKHYVQRYPQVVTWLVLLGISLLEKVRVMKQ